MATKNRYVTLKDLLERHGIHTIRGLREKTGLSSQQCWNLWHGTSKLGRDTMAMLHRTCEIPYDELMAVNEFPRLRIRRRSPTEPPRPKRPRPPEPPAGESRG